MVRSVVPEVVRSLSLEVVWSVAPEVVRPTTPKVVRSAAPEVVKVSKGAKIRNRYNQSKSVTLQEVRSAAAEEVR